MDEAEVAAATSTAGLSMKMALLYCRFCNHPFVNQYRLETHERIHVGNKHHWCPLCGRAFSQPMYLRFHMEQIHGSSAEEAELTAEKASWMHSTTVLDSVVTAQGDIYSPPHITAMGDICTSDPIVDIMDFAPLFHAEDISASLLSICNHGAEFPIQLTVGRTDSDEADAKSFTEQPPTSPSNDDQLSGKGISGTDSVKRPCVRKVRKQQTPQRKPCRSDVHDALGQLDSDISGAVQLGDDDDDDGRQQHGSTSIDDSHNAEYSTEMGMLEAHTPLDGQLSMHQLPRLMSRNPGITEEDTVNCHGEVVTEHVQYNAVLQPTSSENCIQSDSHFTRYLDDQCSIESHCNSQHRKVHTCELCKETFHCTSFLRVHFRRAHGAEIVGIDSDHEDSITPVANPRRRRGRPQKHKKEQCIGMQKHGVAVMENGWTTSRGSNLAKKKNSVSFLESSKNMSIDELHKRLLEAHLAATSGPQKNGSRTNGNSHVYPVLALSQTPRNFLNHASASLDENSENNSKAKKLPEICGSLKEMCKKPLNHKEMLNPRDGETTVAKRKLNAIIKVNGSFIAASKCEQCQKEFQRKSDLKRHIRTHTGEKPYICSQCGRKFGDRSHLRDHEKVHSGHRPHVCTVCGMAFALSNGLLSHSKTHLERRHGCRLCTKKFTRKSDMRRHLQIHAESKPFVCTVCQRSFRCKRQLDDHCLLHSEERPFMCDACGVRFSGRNGLYAHSKVHAEKQHQCKVCPKRFARRTDLNRHERRHALNKL